MNTGLAEDIDQAIGWALKTATPTRALPSETIGTKVMRPYTRDE